MFQLDVIEESNSAWSSPVVLVKKSNGKHRLCLDFRKGNSVTKKYAGLVPNIEGLLSRLTNSHFFTSVDLKDAFWQIPLEESSKEMTAFTIPGLPLLQFKVMLFGLCNAAQRMCKLIDKVVPHQYRESVFPYVDDLLIATATFEEHLQMLKLVANQLTEAGLTINVEKYKFCFKELNYLGYV